MSSFPGMRKLRITANDTKSLATKYSQAHFIYGNTEWFTAYILSISFSNLRSFDLWQGKTPAEAGAVNQAMPYFL